MGGQDSVFLASWEFRARHLLPSSCFLRNPFPLSRPEEFWISSVSESFPPPIAAPAVPGSLSFASVAGSSGCSTLSAAASSLAAPVLAITSSGFPLPAPVFLRISFGYSGLPSGFSICGQIPSAVCQVPSSGRAQVFQPYSVPPSKPRIPQVSGLVPSTADFQSYDYSSLLTLLRIF